MARPAHSPTRPPTSPLSTATTAPTPTSRSQAAPRALTDQNQGSSRIGGGTLSTQDGRETDTPTRGQKSRHHGFTSPVSVTVRASRTTFIIYGLQRLGRGLPGRRKRCCPRLRRHRTQSPTVPAT